MGGRSTEDQVECRGTGPEALTDAQRVRVYKNKLGWTVDSDARKMVFVCDARAFPMSVEAIVKAVAVLDLALPTWSFEVTRRGIWLYGSTKESGVDGSEAGSAEHTQKTRTTRRVVKRRRLKKEE